MESPLRAALPWRHEREVCASTRRRQVSTPAHFKLAGNARDIDSNDAME
jgi:hypothetical protein